MNGILLDSPQDKNHPNNAEAKVRGNQSLCQMILDTLQGGMKAACVFVSSYLCIIVSLVSFIFM